MLRRLITWWKDRTLVRVVIAIDPEAKHRIAVIEVYRHSDPLAWNAFRHFRGVYGAQNVTAASRSILSLGPAPRMLRGQTMTGPVIPRRAPGDPRLALGS